MEQEEALCSQVRTLEFICLSDGVSVGTRCEVPGSVQAIIWWIMFRKCGKLVCLKVYFISDGAN